MNGDSPGDTRAQIVEILGESVRCALNLKEILVEEREALQKRDTVSLSTAADSKLALVREIADLNQTRDKVSAQAGFGDDPDNLEDLADWCDDEMVVSNLWQKLQGIASECDLMNRTNGAIIHLRHQQSLNGLSVLRGGENDAGTYAPTSSATNNFAGRTISEA